MHCRTCQTVQTGSAGKLTWLVHLQQFRVRSLWNQAADRICHEEVSAAWPVGPKGKVPEEADVGPTYSLLHWNLSLPLMLSLTDGYPVSTLATRKKCAKTRRQRLKKCLYDPRWPPGSLGSSASNLITFPGDRENYTETQFLPTSSSSCIVATVERHLQWRL